MVTTVYLITLTVHGVVQLLLCYSITSRTFISMLTLLTFGGKLRVLIPYLLICKIQDMEDNYALGRIAALSDRVQGMSDRFQDKLNEVEERLSKKIDAHKELHHVEMGKVNAKIERLIVKVAAIISISTILSTALLGLFMRYLLQQV